jgi:nucleotide-binding universal stress UspA family protein
VHPPTAGGPLVAAADLPPQAPTGVAAEVCRLTGDPRACLEEASASLDLLVCGSRGHGRFAGRILGSVSGRLVDAARCPVLVIPAVVEARAGRPLGLTTGGAG